MKKQKWWLVMFAIPFLFVGILLTTAGCGEAEDELELPIEDTEDLPDPEEGEDLDIDIE